MKLQRTLALGLVLLTTSTAVADTTAITGDSLVLTGSTPGRLLHDNLAEGSVVVRSAYDAEAEGVVVYEAGKDYVVDLENGEVARVAGSRIPDFATNVLYGQENFDHSKFPGYGNGPFLVYVDYVTEAGGPVAVEHDARALLAGTRKKLGAGGPFKIITYGDSIAAGGEASALPLRFDERYAADLRVRFPKAEITVENGATGGDTTVQGLARLEEKVLTRGPDLVLVGFGMNDHNVNSVPEGAFEENLVSICAQVKDRTGAEILLFSAFPPNPKWMHSAHRMEVYAAATKRAAARAGVAYADVFGVWQGALARKDPPSLLANNINHPNNFGHWLYFEALRAVGF